MKLRNLGGLAIVAALSLSVAAPASAANLAIFGDNNIASLYGGSHVISIVSDAQLATSGFLNGYDAFVYTRDGSSFGQGLSINAAANVKAFVTGNVVLFNGDFQDDIGNAGTDALFTNALSFVLGGMGKGYLGEYIGAFSAYAANGDGYNPIGLVNGTSGVSGASQGGSDLAIDLTAAGMLSSITAGTPFPYNPDAVEFGATLTGENPAKVLARFANGNAAIIASGVDQISDPGPVPEPATWALMIGGFGMAGAMLRRRRVVAA